MAKMYRARREAYKRLAKLRDEENKRGLNGDYWIKAMKKNISAMKKIRRKARKSFEFKKLI